MSFDRKQADWSGQGLGVGWQDREKKKKRKGTLEQGQQCGDLIAGAREVGGGGKGYKGYK